jgi:hypothetical protein
MLLPMADGFVDTPTTSTDFREVQSSVEDERRPRLRTAFGGIS